MVKLTWIVPHQMCRNVNEPRNLRAVDFSQANLVAFQTQERTDAMTCTHDTSRVLCIDVYLAASERFIMALRGKACVLLRAAVDAGLKHHARGLRFTGERCRTLSVWMLSLIIGRAAAVNTCVCVCARLLVWMTFIDLMDSSVYLLWSIIL